MKADMKGLNEEVVRLLREKNMVISAAESCTGGLFAALITDVSGSSSVIKESYITYANSAKINLLGVKEETLNTLGAVSGEVARQMAQGLMERTGADVCVGITGIAGPTGGTEEKPVGLVYAGINIKGQTEVLKMNNKGSRGEVREKSCYEVLKYIKEHI